MIYWYIGILNRMVKVCTENYPTDNAEKNEKYERYHKLYDFPLHDFQKYSIEAIVSGNHSLVCCPTASGKTLCGQFAIDYFIPLGKKVVYTTPVKALSNQIFYNFTQKYPDISIGILTGDVKCNPSADVLIMTTEVLLNKLYQLYSKNAISNSSISFEMDIERELGVVVYDEAHMINDMERGHVWEQCILLLPKHIHMILLSATLADPIKFAKWIENRYNDPPSTKKQVYLIQKKKRSVPLIHYGFVTTTNAIYKAVKDKTIQSQIRDYVNKPFVLQDQNNVFKDNEFYRMQKMLKLFADNNVIIRRPQVLNELSTYLFQNNMLPAMCFVFSRKQIHICAREVTACILPDDSKIPYMIANECKTILRKFSNYEEYIKLPEYTEMVGLLQKGVAIHHSGILPPLREMVEILFSKGYIKLLFCSETMSVGLNMPVKTAVFTDIRKFDGNGRRLLNSVEYTQSAGRSGRLGLDTVGHVIHLNNLFKPVDFTSYRTMMNNKPPVLVSRFKISFNLLLNLIDIDSHDYLQFSRRSMIQEDIVKEMKNIDDDLLAQKNEIATFGNAILNEMQTPYETVNDYINLLDEHAGARNNRRKQLHNRILEMERTYATLLTDVSKVRKYNEMNTNLKLLEEDKKNVENYLGSATDNTLDVLCSRRFIEANADNKMHYKLTVLGAIAAHIREVHCLVFAEEIYSKSIDAFSAIQLVGIFSCFSSVSVPDDLSSSEANSTDKDVNEFVKRLSDKYSMYKKVEDDNNIKTGTEYNIHYELIEYAMKWARCENEQECKSVLFILEQHKNMYVGEFVKAMLKINNISNEMETICEYTGNMPLLSKIRQIKYLTMKHVVTNQSLYI